MLMDDCETTVDPGALDFYADLAINECQRFLEELTRERFVDEEDFLYSLKHGSHLRRLLCTVRGCCPADGESPRSRCRSYRVRDGNSADRFCKFTTSISGAFLRRSSVVLRVLERGDIVMLPAIPWPWASVNLKSWVNSFLAECRQLSLAHSVFVAEDLDCQLDDRDRGGSLSRRLLLPVSRVVSTVYSLVLLARTPIDCDLSALRPLVGHYLSTQKTGSLHTMDGQLTDSQSQSQITSDYPMDPTVSDKVNKYLADLSTDPPDDQLSEHTLPPYSDYGGGTGTLSTRSSSPMDMERRCSRDQHIPTRCGVKNASAVAHNPLQFIAPKQAGLAEQAKQQIKKAEEIKKWKQETVASGRTQLEEEEDWQSGLDLWKSRRRANLKVASDPPTLVAPVTRATPAIRPFVYEEPSEQRIPKESPVVAIKVCDTMPTNPVSPNPKRAVVRFSMETLDDHEVMREPLRSRVAVKELSKMPAGAPQKRNEWSIDEPDSGVDTRETVSPSSISPRSGASDPPRISTRSAILIDQPPVHWKYQDVKTTTQDINATLVKRKSEKGFGFTVKGGKDKKERVLVDGVVLGSAADRAKVLVGDEIISVNTESVQDKYHAKINMIIREAILLGEVQLELKRTHRLDEVQMTDRNPIRRSPSPRARQCFDDKRSIFTHEEKQPPQCMLNEPSRPGRIQDFVPEVERSESASPGSDYKVIANSRMQPGRITDFIPENERSDSENDSVKASHTSRTHESEWVLWSAGERPTSASSSSKRSDYKPTHAVRNYNLDVVTSPALQNRLTINTDTIESGASSHVSPASSQLTNSTHNEDNEESLNANEDHEFTEARLKRMASTRRIRNGIQEARVQFLGLNDLIKRVSEENQWEDYEPAVAHFNIRSPPMKPHRTVLWLPVHIPPIDKSPYRPIIVDAPVTETHFPPTHVKREIVFSEEPLPWETQNFTPTEAIKPPRTTTNPQIIVNESTSLRLQSSNVTETVIARHLGNYSADNRQSADILGEHDKNTELNYISLAAHNNATDRKENAPRLMSDIRTTGDHWLIQEATHKMNTTHRITQTAPLDTGVIKCPKVIQTLSPNIESGPRVTQTAQIGPDQVVSVSGKQKCSHCSHELGRGAAMIIESLGLFYHLDCFSCCVCGICLGSGNQGADVRVRNGRLHCHSCYSNDEAGLKFSEV